MKKIEKQRTVVKIDVTYEAFDGTIFESEDECKKYEKTAQCAINRTFNKLPQYQIGGDTIAEVVALNYDDRVHSIYIKDVDTLEIFNRWLAQNYWNSYFKGQLSVDTIGTVQLFVTYEDDIWLVGSADEYKKSFCDMIDDNLVKPLMEKINGAKEEN